MRIWSVPPLVALLALLAGVAPLSGADDPGDVYLQAFQSFKAAERQETAGRMDDALQKYRFCLSVLQQIQKTNPDYEPPVVEFRLRKSRESIARVQSLQSAPLPPVTPPPDPRPTPAATAASSPPNAPAFHLPALPTSYRLQPSGAAPPPAAVTPAPAARTDLFEGAGETMERSAINGLKDRIRELQLRLSREKQMNAELEEKLLGSTAREQSTLTEMDRWRVQAVEQKSQLDQTQQALGDLQNTNDQLTAEKQIATKKIASLQSDLDAAKADLEVADEDNGELFAKLENAAKFIDASEKIRGQLLKERKQLSARDGNDADLKKIRRERDAAVAKTESLQERVRNSAELAEQSKDLSARLTAAEIKVAAAAKSRDERDKIEGGLKDEISSVNKTLAAMREQLSAGGKRIVELEKQLADTSSATMNASGAMAQENALLKSLVVRQINEQAKRQQTRRLVQEEMEKLQVRSSALVEKLNALGAAETTLTPAEKRLFDQPVAGSGNGVDFSLSITKQEPASDLPAALLARAKEANELSNKNRFSEARAIYEDIALKAPQSYIAVINLGITDRQLGDNVKAIAAFKRALEIRPEDAYALTNLGKTELNNGDVSAAIDTLRKAVEADPANHYVHYLLAMALRKNGDPVEASKEVTRTLELSPGYLPGAQLRDELNQKAARDQATEPVSGDPR